MTWRKLSALVSVLLLAGCGTSTDRSSPDDAALHQDIAAGRAGAEVTLDGTLAADPIQVGTHEHLLVRTPAGDSIEVDHNTTLAPAVPAHAGDQVIVHGLLYIDPGPRAGVHCTHAHTSHGCPLPGWIEFAGSYYE